MWSPAIAVSEIVLLTVLSVAAFAFMRRHSYWILGVVPCFAIAALVTPADPGSTLLGGALLTVPYIGAVLVTRWLLHDPRE